MGHGACDIHQKPSANGEHTTMLDNTWSPGVTNTTPPPPALLYCRGLHILACYGCLKKYNNINFTKKRAPIEDFDKFHNDDLDRISESMELMVHTGKYAEIITTQPTST